MVFDSIPIVLRIRLGKAWLGTTRHLVPPSVLVSGKDDSAARVAAAQEATIAMCYGKLRALHL